MMNLSAGVQRLFYSGILAVVLCGGTIDAQTTAHGEYAEDILENGLMWMFEKGLPMFFSKVSLEEPEGTQTLEDDMLLQLGKDIDNYLYKETKARLEERPREFRLYDNYLTLLSPDTDHPIYEAFSIWGKGLSKFIGGGYAYYTADCYLRDIQDTVIEYWVITGFELSFFRHYDKQLFFITVADTITAPRRVALRSDQFVESVEVGGRTIQFPRDNLSILADLKAWAYPLSYLNSDLADYRVKYKKIKNTDKYEPYLKKIGRVKRFFYSWNEYDRGYIGKKRIVRR